MDNYDIQEQDTLDNITEYAESEAMLDLVETMRMTFCPDCGSEITDENPLIEEEYKPEYYGYCQDCYDPTPSGPEYSPGFEMNH